ncbi:MAG: metallophosphoesterase [Proteobacteria bacterium]|nr:metallophosphoesterase [Pseudomonadota bacterium]
MSALGNAAFRLAHLSDLHLPMANMALPWRDVFSKRLFSLISWQIRRRHIHRPEILDLLVADLLAHRPDHIAVTGDVTNLSLADEFDRSFAWLERLGKPQSVTLIPGNHDRLVALAPDEGPSRWTRWMQGDDGSADFPFVRVRGAVVLVGVNTAVPTRLFQASGRAGAGQIARLKVKLAELGRHGLFRVVLIHHPVGKGLAPDRKALDDRAGICAAIAEAGAELVLHGHNHTAEFYAVDGPAGPIPVIGVPAASTIATAKDARPGKINHAARWHLIEIARTSAGWHTAVTARRLTQSGAFETCGRFAFDAPQAAFGIAS